MRDRGYCDNGPDSPVGSASDSLYLVDNAEPLFHIPIFNTGSPLILTAIGVKFAFLCPISMSTAYQWGGLGPPHLAACVQDPIGRG